MLKHPPIRVAVVGLGRSGYNIHLKAIRRLPEKYQLVAVADAWTERSKAVGAELNVSSYDSLESLLDESNVELVTIASPNHLHVPQTISTLHHGKHALCEKPFGLSAKDADAMRSASVSSGFGVYAYYSRRYESAFQKVCSVVRSGLLGKITFIRMNWSGFGRRWDWQTLRKFDGGQLNNNFPHALDQALRLLEAAGVGDIEDLEVSSELQNAFGVGDADDHVRVTLRSLSTAITLVIEMFSTQAYSTERWMICGTAGGLRGDTNTIDWKWLRWEDGVQRVPSHEPFADRLYCQEELAWNSDTFTATDKFGDWQYSFYDDLYRSIRCGTEPFVSFESARSVAAILERVRTASREQDLQS